MPQILFWIMLVLIPFGMLILEVSCNSRGEGGFGFFVGGAISLVILLGVYSFTAKVIQTDLVPKDRITVETTKTHQYIYIKSKDRKSVSTLIFDNVEKYLLIESGEFQIIEEKWGNFVVDNYKTDYKVEEINEK